MSNCTNCGNPGRLTRTSPRKSDGKSFPIYECTSGCMNGRYTFSWYPPREQQAQVQQVQAAPQVQMAQPAVNPGNSKAMQILERIEKRLTNIEAYIVKASGAEIQITTDEMTADSEVPF